MKKIGTWSAAFTITVDGIQIDLAELPQQNQIDIFCALMRGITAGEIIGNEEVGCVKAAS